MKTTATALPTDTPVAPVPGVVEETVGGMVSGSVMTTTADLASETLPAPSFAQPYSVTLVGTVWAMVATMP